MAGIQRPFIIFRHKWPVLDRHVVRRWIVPDVFDGSTDFVGVIEEGFPAAGFGPDGMVLWEMRDGAKPQAAGFLEIFDHFLSLVFVFSNQNMNVIGQDGTGITCVFMLCYGVRKTCCDQLDGVYIQLDQRKFQNFGRCFVKSFDVP